MPKSRKPKATIAPAARRPPPRIEYRARSHEAWYGARVVVQDGHLRVMFEDFLEDADEWYDPDAPELASPRAVDALRVRFRRATSSASPATCTAARSNTATPSSRPYVLRAAPYSRRHRGRQRAVRVPFTVRWTEGPRRGCQEKVGAEVVCCVQESPIQDPELTEFLDDVRNRFGEDQGEATAASQQAAPTRTPAGSRRYGGFPTQQTNDEGGWRR
ncbi:hypothetical protein VPH35_139315 [Triticum aestivum]